MNIPYSPKSLTLKFTYHPDDDQMCLKGFNQNIC